MKKGAAWQSAHTASVGIKRVNMSAKHAAIGTASFSSRANPMPLDSQLCGCTMWAHQETLANTLKYPHPRT